MGDPLTQHARHTHLRDALLIALGVGVLVWCLHTGITTALKERLFDFRCFHEAAIAAADGENIYEGASRGYIYPPLLAAIIEPLGELNIRSAGVCWSIGNVVLVAITAWLAACEVARRFALNLTRPQIAALAAFGMLVVADKLNRELKEGNCNVLILLGVVLALRWVGTLPLLCGLALAFAIHIKYLPIVFIPFLLLRGFWRDAAATLVGIVLLALLPAIRFGWDRNLEYLRTAITGMNHMAGGSASGSGANIHPLAWEFSISIPSAAARAVARLGADPSWTWIATGVIAAIVFLAAWRMYRRERVGFLVRATRSVPDPSEPVGLFVFEWSALLAVALAFSPQTVARHANMALPLAIVAGAMVLHASGRTRVLAGMAAGLLFVGLTFPPGIDSLDHLAKDWRTIGGISWCLVAMVLMLRASVPRGREVLRGE